jgi:hypothetical protein
MPSLRDSIGRFLPTTSPSVRLFVEAGGGTSVREAIWHHKLRAINQLFLGSTSEEEVDQALALMLSAESGDEMAFLINNVTWDGLDDDLDEPDLDQILRHASLLLERRDFIAIRFLRRAFGVDPWTLPQVAMGDLTASAASMPWYIRQSLADEIAARRDALLDGVALTGLRGRPTLAREMRVVVDFLSGAGHHVVPLTSLSWELQYTDLIVTQLARGEVGVLILRLSDLVNAQLPAVQRGAWFDMLRRWEREFMAMDALVRVIGNTAQKADMRRFMDLRRLFMDNFPAVVAPATGIQQSIQAILAAIGAVGTGFQDLALALRQFADSINDFSIPKLFGTDADQNAFNIVNTLAGQDVLARLPSAYKSELVNRMLDGGVEDEEEQATLTVLRMSKARSTADFAQLAAQASWERLYTSFEGQEYEDLERLFTF